MDQDKKLNIVMFNMSAYSEWENGVQNRNFHILKNLRVDERIGKILAIDYLPHNFKRAARIYRENILRKTKSRIVFRSLFSRAVEVDEKLIVFSSILAKISTEKFYSELKFLIKKIGFTNYIVFSCYPLKVSYFENLPAKLYIFDTVDNWSEHPSFKNFKEKLIENYKVIDKKADLIFTVADELKNNYANKEKIHWIPNGVDLKHYQNSYPIINRDIGELKHPLIGYVGTIQDRLDQDLLEYLAKSNPEKSLVMIGPVWYKKIIERFSPYANIHFLGRKTYEEVPMYIQQFDVGIIPHKVDKFVESTNPMKIYEYLACGKPVVSTKGSGVDLFGELVYATNDFKEFNIKINEAIANDSEQLKEKRLEAIKDHSWLKRVDKMLELIISKL